MGAFGVLVNVAVFNLCIHTYQLAPVRSGVFATAAAICTNYVGNRYWTYRHADKSRLHRELTLFLFFSGLGLVIENGMLALSHYGLGYTSSLADNVAKNVIGLGLATAFRFWSYRTWVFREDPAASRPEPAHQDADTPADPLGTFPRPHGEPQAQGRPTPSGTSLDLLDVPAEEQAENRRQLLK
ncbi:GtrA family protein [Streptomyces sp. NPDC005438]|uniref:GtrA family protein n=1 Tax=Streptomyces sp. NPDC005438 TaxID=3156880 RepID=UPI0033BEC276